MQPVHFWKEPGDRNLDGAGGVATESIQGTFRPGSSKSQLLLVYQ